VVADIKEAAFSASAADLINAPSNCAAAFDPLPSLVHVFIIERVFDKSIKKRGNVHDRDAFATHARRKTQQLAKVFFHIIEIKNTNLFLQ
jgi:hypothetical protein